MRSTSVDHSEMRFGRRGRKRDNDLKGSLGITQKIIDIIHVRNSPIDLAISYHLISTQRPIK